jgi:hypothetical protein
VPVTGSVFASMKPPFVPTFIDATTAASGRRIETVVPLSTELPIETPVRWTLTT